MDTSYLWSRLLLAAMRSFPRLTLLAARLWPFLPVTLAGCDRRVGASGRRLAREPASQLEDASGKQVPVQTRVLEIAWRLSRWPAQTEGPASRPRLCV